MWLNNDHMKLFYSLVGLLAFTTAGFSQNLVDLSLAGTYETGVFDDGAMEILAHDPVNHHVFVVNASTQSIDILDISTPSSITKVTSIDLSPYGKAANSVSYYGGYVVAAVEDTVKQANGKAVFFDAQGTYVAHVTVGALPDMVTFSHDGNTVLVANEGEPNDDYTVDPEGTVSIIDVSGGVANVTQSDVTEINFQSFNSNYDQNIRVFGPGSTLAMDLEPEYIALSDDDAFAYVVMQENNAMAKIDLSNNTVVSLKALGFKDWMAGNNVLDASNTAASVDFRHWPIYGMYQPDAMVSFEHNGSTYIATANEGDSRDYDGFSEEDRVKDLMLDSVVFPNYANLQMNDSLGRMNITTTLGDTDNDGYYEELYAYGARSFSIWDSNMDLVYDSEGDIAANVFAAYPNEFNSNNDDNSSLKSRSDDKGTEPEAVEVAVINGTRVLFVGLERMGGVIVYDITDPTAPQFVSYFLNRNFNVDADAPGAGDLAPEDLVFISAAQSPTGYPLLASANEVSGTFSLYNIGGTIGLEEEVKENAIYAFPNPVVDMVTFNKEVENGLLYDMNGRVVSEIEGTEADLSNLPAGLYVLMADNVKGLQILKK